MACLLKVLSDMLQNPRLLYHIHICPKLKVKLGPTEFSIRRHRVLISQPLPQNPSLFGLTDRDLGLTEMGL